jgi:hypothetical protein
MSDTTAAALAVRYIKEWGLKLVPIPRGTKAPREKGWNKEGNYISDPTIARERWSNGAEGIGVVLGPSGLCSLDIDWPEQAEPVLAALGIDLRALRKMGPTIRGNPARYRLIFAAPNGVVLGRKILAWPRRAPGEEPPPLFELRGGDIQDVFPPTEHPDFHIPYVWEIEPDGAFPLLPGAILELWQNWDSYCKELEALCPWGKKEFNPKPAHRGAGARPNVIAAFNKAHTVEAVLEAHGYKRCGDKRWLSPSSSSGLAGVVILDSGRVFSHHGTDPLFGKHSHDAFDLFRILDHGGDTKSAVKAAAEELGIGEDPRGFDKEVEDHAFIIDVTPGKLVSSVNESAAALKAANAPVYLRGDALYRPVRIEAPPTDDDHVRRPVGAVVLRPVEVPWVRFQLARAARFVKWDARKGGLVLTNPPVADVAELIASHADEGGWPQLIGVASHPVLTSSGRVISTPGYDQRTGLLIEITGDWPIPSNPTRDDAASALARLKYLLRHFPWVSDVDRAVGISMLLTTVARPALPAAPGHAVDSPEAGSGKSLLVNGTSMLANGVEAPVMDYGQDAVEAGKRLDSMLLAGDSLISIDNIDAPLEGSALCQTLTESSRSIRILGLSKDVKVKCRAMITFTGNNLVVVGDLVRRVVICRLDAGVERPEQRVIKQNLIAEVREKRQEIVGDIITIMLAYQRAGCPDVGVSPFGSYEPWSRMVRQALVWVGEEDPCLSLERTRGDDPSRQSLAGVLEAWHTAFGGVATTAAAAVEQAKANAGVRMALAPVCGRRGELDTTVLGRWLRGNKDKRSGRLVLRGGKHQKAGVPWLVVRIGGDDGDDSDDVLAQRGQTVSRNKEGKEEKEYVQMTVQGDRAGISSPSSPSSPATTPAPGGSSGSSGSTCGSDIEEGGV